MTLRHHAAHHARRARTLREHVKTVHARKAKTHRAKHPRYTSTARSHRVDLTP